MNSEDTNISARVTGTVHTWEKIAQAHNQERAALFYRANKLHSPIYTIPFEVLSHILQGTLELEDPLEPDLRTRSISLRQAFVLASVSTRFRNVALATPELWQRIFLPIPADEPTDWAKCRSLLHHCASYARHLELSIRADGFDSPFAFLSTKMITEIFSSVVNQKIKALELMSSFNTLDGMLLFLSSLPILDTFVLHNDIDGPEAIDLSSLPLSRVAIYDIGSYEVGSLESISLPSSVEVLRLIELHIYLKLDFLKQCPNVVELVLDNRYPRLDNPVTLNHLKRLSVTTIYLGATPLANLQTPILDFLSLGWSLKNKEEHLASIIPFCRQVSTSLTTLVLDYFPGTWTAADFKLLFGLLPKLQSLGLHPRSIEDIIQPIRALHYQEDNCEKISLPNLERLVVGSHSSGWEHFACFPYQGETSCFNLDFRTECYVQWAQTSLPQLRDQLRCISRGRHIEITYYNKRIEWLYVE